MFYLLRKWPARNELFFFSPLGSRVRARPEGRLNRTFGARARAHPTPKKVQSSATRWVSLLGTTLHL